MHREGYPKPALLAELAYAAVSRTASFFWVQIPGEAPVISGSSVAVASVFWAHVVKVQLLRLGPVYTSVAELAYALD